MHRGGARLQRNDDDVGRRRDGEGHAQRLHDRKAVTAEDRREIGRARDIIGNHAKLHGGEYVTAFNVNRRHVAARPSSRSDKASIVPSACSARGRATYSCPTGAVALPSFAPTAASRTWLARDAGFELRPNGVALAADGSFLLANLGDAGGVWRLDQQGALTPWLLEVDGVAAASRKFRDRRQRGRTWITVSTRCRPRQLAWRADVADGFVVLVDEHGARIVADGLHYTNECRPDPSGEWLYVVETFGRRLDSIPHRRARDG